MLIEGSWWVNEASSTFTAMEAYGYGKKDRRLALMPMPKVDGTKLGAATYFNSEQSQAFINGNLSGDKLVLAKEFFKFAYSEKGMQIFTTETETALCLDYELTDAQYEGLTTFGKSLWDIHSGESGAKVIHKLVTNPELVPQQSKLNYGSSFNSKVNGSTYNVSVDVFRKKTMTAVDFFKGISTLYSKDWGEINIVL